MNELWMFIVRVQGSASLQHGPALSARGENLRHRNTSDSRDSVVTTELSLAPSAFLINIFNTQLNSVCFFFHSQASIRCEEAFYISAP